MLRRQGGLGSEGLSARGTTGITQSKQGPAWLTRRATHLTNDAVQKTMAGYGAFEEANKLSMAQLQAALSGQVGPCLARQTAQGAMQHRPHGSALSEVPRHVWF